MLRKIAISSVVLAFVLAGCDKPSSNDENEVHMAMPTASNANLQAPPPPFVPPPDIIIQTNSPNALFSLQHDLTVAMPHDSVATRFQAARDACLKDKSLHCTLASASLTITTSVSGQLQIALPHDQVAVFEKRLLKHLPQDGRGRAEITSRSTSTENQTAASADIDRQMVQAKAYRDQLEQLAKRPNLTVEEVLKIHEALTEAQSAVDTAEAAKRASDSNIVLERMNISFEEAKVPVERSPFAKFWKNAHDVFMASVADMLLRIVNVLPWLPIALVLAWLVARFTGRLKIRRAQKVRVS
jgi:hypothetical protein